MGPKRINPRLVKKNRPYTVIELADALGVHKNTVRNWLSRGLATVDRHRPMIFRGSDVIAFLARRRKDAKRPLGPGTMLCLRCKAPRKPASKMIDGYRSNASSANLQALCGVCGAIMNRRVALAEISAAMPQSDVQFQLVPSRLKERRDAPLNCDSNARG